MDGRGGNVVGANEHEDRRMLLLPLSRLQWVSGSLAVSKSNPVFVVELVFRVGAAMNDTTVAQLIFITPFPIHFVTFFMMMKLTVEFSLSLSSNHTHHIPPL